MLYEIISKPALLKKFRMSKIYKIIHVGTCSCCIFTGTCCMRRWWMPWTMDLLHRISCFLHLYIYMSQIFWLIKRGKGDDRVLNLLSSYLLIFRCSMLSDHIYVNVAGDWLVNFELFRNSFDENNWVLGDPLQGYIFYYILILLNLRYRIWFKIIWGFQAPISNNNKVDGTWSKKIYPLKIKYWKLNIYTNSNVKMPTSTLVPLPFNKNPCTPWIVICWMQSVFSFRDLQLIERKLERKGKNCKWII